MNRVHLLLLATVVPQRTDRVAEREKLLGCEVGVSHIRSSAGRVRYPTGNSQSALRLICQLRDRLLRQLRIEVREPNILEDHSHRVVVVLIDTGSAILTDDLAEVPLRRREGLF